LQTHLLLCSRLTGRHLLLLYCCHAAALVAHLMELLVLGRCHLLLLKQEPPTEMADAGVFDDTVRNHDVTINR
jgi:hypothetical protein